MIYIKGIKIKENIKITRQVFPFNLSIVKYIDNFKFDSPVTIILGENGVGKSTLVEAMAINLGFNAEGGNRNINFSTFDSHSELSDYITLLKIAIPKKGFFLRSETLYSLETKLTEYFEDCDLHESSHGEGVVKLLFQYLRPNGIYILDEPESALSPTSQFVFLNLMHHLAENCNCQFIIATHSPIIAGYEYAKIYEISEYYGPLEKKYQDTLLVTLYRKYLDSAEYRKCIIDLD